ncbi:MAG: type IV pilus modification PilV family protein [Actinomycetes bacterium]
MAHRGDAGESLVELVISIGILGVGVIALLAGMGTAATTGGLHREQTLEVQYLRSAAEAVQDATYVPCAASYANGVAPASGYTVSVSVKDASGAAFASPCNDTGLQRVTITVGQTDSRVRGESLVVVKRQPCSNGGATPC